MRETGGATQPPLAVLLLGLLAERPMHPYEMFQTTIDRREDRLVKVRPGTVYHAVDRLAAQELIEIQDVVRDGNRPERTVYTITDAGRKALDDSLERILARHPEEYPELYLALSEAHGLPRSRVVELLGVRLSAMHDELGSIDGVAREAADCVPEMFYLDFGCRKATLRAQIDWLENLVDRLKNHTIEWLDDEGSSYRDGNTPTASTQHSETMHQEGDRS